MLKKRYFALVTCMLVAVVFLCNTMLVCFGAAEDQNAAGNWMQGVYNKQETKIEKVTSCKCTTYDGQVSGDMTGTYNFSELEFITIMSGELRYNGIAKGKWNAVLNGTHYSGIVKDTFYSDSERKNVNVKCILLGEEAEGLMECSLSREAIFSLQNGTFSGNCLITKLNKKNTQVSLNVTGKFDIEKIDQLRDTSISVNQSAFSGKTKEGLNIYPVVTNILIADENSPYNNEGFSNISYSSSKGSGTAWAYSSISDDGLISVDGIIRGAVSGTISGKINFSNVVWKMKLSINEGQLQNIQKPILKMSMWGPSTVSAGQTGYIGIQYSNTGDYYAENVKILLNVPAGVEFLAASPGGSFSSSARTVTWEIGKVDKNTFNYLYINVRFLSTAKFTALLYNDTQFCCKAEWTVSQVLYPHDPNAKYGPSGPYTPGEKLNYKVEFENEGQGEAFGVFFTDTLDKDLDDTTLVIGPVYSTKDNTQIAPKGIYDPATRTITWFAGDVKSKEGGYAEYSIKVNSGAKEGTEILNFATVYFPYANEETRTNPIIGYVKDSTPPILYARPGGGSYNSVISITINSSEIADIYYTTDNSVPNENSTKYVGPIVLNKDTELRFMGIDYFGNKSIIYNEKYKIRLHGRTNTPYHTLSPSPTPSSSASPTSTPTVTPVPTNTIKPTHHGRHPFKDIDGHWAKEDIINLYWKGILAGYEDNSIRPDCEINRAEVVVMILKALGIKPADKVQSGFRDDKNIPEWAKGYITAAKDMNIIKGFDDGRFKPLEKCTREQIAAISIKAFEFKVSGDNKADFADVKDIGEWYLDYVGTASSLGVITGYTDKTFKPKSFTKRAEAIVIINRCLNIKESGKPTK
ncbi:S-layer homology domain-containing protein [Acetivibrio cellulolyticus]|uniref:S-layer homology domain-containing protein n=1 Tax=Acetivibrio cellulolyticus TaxID=35830 RepID=UPI0001E2C1CA|nr:S-layer homology domain-containing protein [Acetivibrio cellulolyticus]